MTTLKRIPAHDSSGRRPWLSGAARLWRQLMLLPAIVSLAVSATAQTPTPPQNRPLKDMMGVVTKFSQGQSTVDLPLLKDLGVKWVRDAVMWPEIEPRSFDFVPFSPALQQRLDYYKANDIGVVVMLYLDNPAAYPATLAEPFRALDPVAFGRFGAVVAQRMKAMGLRFVIEVWNEPHNSLLQPMGGQWNGRPSSPWLDHYVRMVRETVAQVKAVDPKIKVINNDDMWVLHYWFLEGGLPAELDGFAVHPYSPGPETTAIWANTDWVYPFQAVDIDRSFQSAVRRLREQGLLKMGRAPEIWVTEWGWPIGGTTPSGTVTESLLAALLPRAYVVAHASGVEALTWFSLQDSVDGPMGLTTNTGVKRLSYSAFKTLRVQLGEMLLSRQMIGQTHLTSGVQAYLYKSAGRRTSNKLVIWNVGSDLRTLVFPTAWNTSSVTVTDALGRQVKPSVDARGYRSVTVGMSPLYVGGIDDDSNLTRALQPLQ